MSGTFYCVGVGPGDPDLLTIKALKLLKSGATVAYPVGADSGTSFARSIAAPHIPVGTKEFGFAVPMRESRTPAIEAYNQAAETIRKTLMGGKDVVLLCEGDPFFYGSAMYLFERLADEFKTQVVPGITSLTACAAASERPLAARNDILKVIPAPLEEKIIIKELKGAESAAIIKVGRHFEKVRRVLKEMNLEESAIIIEAATGENENIRSVSDFDASERPYFSTILVYKGGETWGQPNG